MTALAMCGTRDEANSHRGINKSESSVLNFIRNRNEKDQNIIFYSDKCAGQQKNKFMIALYKKRLPKKRIRICFTAIFEKQNYFEEYHFFKVYLL